MTKSAMLGVALLIALAASSMAQQNKTQVKRGSARPTSAASGKEMYVNYCASCHGTDAKGAGPAAGALKTSPPDLTALAKNNGGQYPAEKVLGVLRGTTETTAHGNREMPVWGPVFRRLSHGDEAEVQLRTQNLSDYLKSIQVK